MGQRERLLTALATLPPTQREIVLLHDLEDWTHAEIAEIAAIPRKECRGSTCFRLDALCAEILAGDKPRRDDERQ